MTTCIEANSSDPADTGPAPYRCVDTPTHLSELCGELRGQRWVALDCEFMRESTYYPRLCLLQVATHGITACIDTLALSNFDCLAEMLFDPDITKVFHAAQQDLETILVTLGAVPAPVFDTQIAATLLGYRDQIGYAELVNSVLGVELDKAHTRADWSRRPLGAAQLQYAAEDVLYLCGLYEKQIEALESMGRLAWLNADFEALTAPGRYSVEPMEAWRRVKGAKGLRRNRLPVLQHLAAWREQHAASANLPRRWVLSDTALLALVKRPPSTLEELGNIRDLKDGWIRKHGGDILEVIVKATQLSPEQWPREPERRAPAPGEDALLDTGMAVLRLCALKHKVATESLGNRRDLESILAGDKSSPLLRGWRNQLAGTTILDFFDGKLRLGVEQGQLKIV